MEKHEKVYEGKTKVLFATDSPGLIIQHFKDDATAFNAAKRGVIDRKGILDNKISAKIFEFLESRGVPTHYERLLNDRETLVKHVDVIPIEVVIRNRAAGSLCRRLGLIEGQILECPIIEYCLKNDELSDPMINETHIRALKIATDEDMETLREYAYLINNLLTKYFLEHKLELIDFKLEFGHFKGKIILADEISPDTCRLWEVGTGEKFDKDRFRRDLGRIEEAYQEVLSRVSH